MNKQNKIETEAKFVITKSSTFLALQQLAKLGLFKLKSGGVRAIVDQYMDTPQMHLYRSGYACRIRDNQAEKIITLKSLTPAEGNLHRRKEIEQVIESEKPETWDDGEVKQIIQKLAGSSPLQTLFVIHQTRHIRYASLQERTVLECALDEVSLNKTDHVDYYSLEAELLETGQEADLLAFIDTLQTKWLLRPERLSKFEHGLINMNQQMEGALQKLNQVEKITLAQLAEHKNKHFEHRAKIILMSDADLPDKDIAQKLGVSVRTVQKWKRRFDKTRLGIFPEELVHNLLTEESTIPPLQQPKAANAEMPAPEKPQADSTSPESEAQQPPLPQKVGLELTDSMAEAGRKVLAFHLARMLHYEPGARLGEDIDALHKMRVATRRMRAALRVFGQAYIKKKTKSIRRGLKLTGQALGWVRDLDVSLKKLDAYRQSLPSEEQAGVIPLIKAWQAEREEARGQMLLYLDSKTFAQFKKEMSHFVNTEGYGAKPIPTDTDTPIPYQIRHIGPRLIYSRYEEVIAYEPILDNASLKTLHNLRIAFKNWRYTLEFFEELLGPEAKQVIAQIKNMQDHLGDLNDADVANKNLRDYLAQWEEYQQDLPLAQRESPNHVIGYLTAKLNERHQLSTTFPETWTAFNQPELKRNLALAVAAL